MIHRFFKTQYTYQHYFVQGVKNTLWYYVRSFCTYVFGSFLLLFKYQLDEIFNLGYTTQKSVNQKQNKYHCTTNRPFILFRIQNHKTIKLSLNKIICFTFSPPKTYH